MKLSGMVLPLRISSPLRSLLSTSESQVLSLCERYERLSAGVSKASCSLAKDMYAKSVNSSDVATITISLRSLGLMRHFRIGINDVRSKLTASEGHSASISQENPLIKSKPCAPRSQVQK